MTTTHDDMPLPEPDTHCEDLDTGKECWSYSADLLRARDAQWQARLQAAERMIDKAQAAALHAQEIAAKANARAFDVQQDAERYRFLRDVSTITWRSFQEQWRMPKDKCDAVIDAAIRARGQT